MKKLSSAILLFILCMMLSACGNPKAPDSASAFVGESLDSVVTAFEKAGFKNIDVLEIQDLTSKSDLQDGDVSEISINNDNNFSAKAEYDKDVPVVITYHTIRKVVVPISPSEIQDVEYETIVTLFTNAGFENISKNEVFDLDPDIFSVDFQNEVSIQGNADFAEGDSVPFDAPVSVISHKPFARRTVNIHIDFQSNLFFNKYGVVVALDGDKETLEHGEDSDIEYQLKDGDYVLTFTSAESSSINGETRLNVSSDVDASFKISCNSDNISVETIYIDNKFELADDEVKIMTTQSEFRLNHYNSTIATLKEWGFTNIIEKPLYDIRLGWTEEGSVESVTINGETEYKRGDVYKQDSEVIVSYHLNQDDDPSRIAMAKDSYEYEGQHFLEVKNELQEMGFSNVVLEECTSDDYSKINGEVDEVSINYIGFDIGDSFKPEDLVTIRHYPEKNVLTVENSEALAGLIYLDWEKDRNDITDFAFSHVDEIVDLEMMTAFVENYKDSTKEYSTRFNYTLYAVDSENALLSGPVFLFENVNYSELNLNGANVPDSFGSGIHCRVRAVIDGIKDGMILLDPISIEVF